MIVYPTIELQNGKCVSLKRGHLDQPMIWHVNPVEIACEYADAGAAWIHITDFDAIEGRDSNRELIIEIIRQCGVSVQLGGGIRTLEHVADWIDLGAGRVVIGTAAVKDPDMVKQAAKLHPDQVVLAIDVFKGKILTDGWRQESAFAASDFVKAFDGVPLAAVLFTDIDADLEDRESGASEVTALAEATRSPVIASGLVRTLDDVSMLKYAGSVSGVIIGRALFNKTIDLTEALQIARPEPEPVADFI
jgi:phosphoribosylformimino-5-aminoimidazole carboxamide ribotide isomerase